MNCVFQVSGLKDSGKTSVIERVIREAKLKGMTVTVIKKSHHIVDPEGKDTWRFRNAGADLVLFTGSDEVTSLLLEKSPFDLVDYLPSHIIIIEGYNQETVGEKFVVGSPDQVEEISKQIIQKLDQCHDTHYLNIMGNEKDVTTDLKLWLIYNLMRKMNIDEVRLGDR
ncbi:molybdopterin-guanine dinucleotide biosynthesis protein B [Sulfuracidifex metallicus]|uniref:Molybdopterin-guanine dinucleotide biosynthesis protein B n=1 Tax=Sulfuracidifex metallicus DSM 6482 = JCM 9184 TaxID=523847 RepID=A0A6A9QKG4_SULME|nr:molybdopterin-guanine dinucleotide biosynthesis protein B [Sulfuracidifex metallicus]MUN28218.1 molybdopterin-guanine dinucleotide biosynthesis protein B [Sulfuracidifex metallicus DSM 6482 = JCM 9184]WOE51249.1 molybdopterin-guanine dinucleotide biosynthesis protein B [Sulfuracidifex metallicus DSM 6482 = JCM 9184]